MPYSLIMLQLIAYDGAVLCILLGASLFFAAGQLSFWLFDHSPTFAMRAECVTLLLLQFAFIFQFLKSVNTTKKTLPLWDLNEPAPTETEEEQQSPAITHSQNIRLSDAVDISSSQTGKESDCEIHHH